jgi:hypothetical protein
MVSNEIVGIFLPSRLSLPLAEQGVFIKAVKKFRFSGY